MHNSHQFSVVHHILAYSPNLAADQVQLRLPPGVELINTRLSHAHIGRFIPTETLFKMQSTNTAGGGSSICYRGSDGSVKV